MTENENVTEEYTENEAAKPKSGKKEKIISFAAKVLQREFQSGKTSQTAGGITLLHRLPALSH